MFLEFLLVLLSMHHGAREDMDFSTVWTLGLPVVQPLTSVSAIDRLGCGCCMKNTCRFTSRVRVCRKLCICSGQWFPRCLRCGEGGFVTSSIIFAPMQLGFFSFLFFFDLILILLKSHKVITLTERDFCFLGICRPRWPAAAFVSADVLVTAMAYRTPHVVIPFCNLYLPIL